jgi:hypothetical protein
VAGDGQDLSREQQLLNRKIITTALHVIDGTLTRNRAERIIARAGDTDAALARILLDELVRVGREELEAALDPIPFDMRIYNARLEPGWKGYIDAHHVKRAVVKRAPPPPDPRVEYVRYLLGWRPLSPAPSAAGTSSVAAAGQDGEAAHASRSQEQR